MSSESESDEDYVPGKPEQLSEEESADEETEAQYEKEVELKANKRKSLQTKLDGKKRKISNVQTRNNHLQESDKEEKEEPQEVIPEVEKKKEDDLWAMFLDGTDAPKPNISTANKQIKTASIPAQSSNGTIATKIPPIDVKAEIKSKEAKIFEFAGEKVVVENNVIKEVLKATPSSATSLAAGSTPASTPSRARGSGGLSGLLGQLNKKNKLSTLEKTKLDWETFKKKEGIEEELQTFNKGKDGYLERQDFLERADLRQFEIERDLRTGRRSNR